MVCAVGLVLVAGCRDEPSPATTLYTATGTAAAAPPSPEAVSVRSEPDSVILYEYIYPYNTESLIENHYVELAMRGDTVTGRYYGTTDDFDTTREGYLPGFFATTMNDLRMDANAISFTLAPWDFFTTPRTPGTDPDAVTDETRWKGPELAPSRSYRGVVTPDRITLQSPYGPREFARGRSR